MHEIELKFAIAPERLAAVRHAVVRPGARPLRLQAAYYDTPDGRLAAAGIALRLRSEDGRWVQTLKVGLDPMRRLEHNVTVEPAGGAAPELDLAHHDGTPAGKALREALGPAGAAALVNRFATDVTRHVRLVYGRGPTLGARVEVALDEGQVFAGERRQLLCELEMELLHGTPAALIELARQWAGRLGLWLDVRSKSWRGEVLAQGLQQAPAAKAGAPRVDAQSTVDQAWRAVLQSCLDQVLANASELASLAPDAAAPEHVHQLRVGLRRLRSALRLFDGQVPMGERWNERLAEVFAQLGQARDRDVFFADVLPALRDAGAPQGAVWAEAGAPPPAPPIGPRLRDPDLTQLWLELLAAQHAPPAVGHGAGSTEAPGPVAPARRPGDDAAAPAGVPQPPWRDGVAAHLKRWHKRIRRAAGRLEHLPDAQIHRLRKRAKRLRYAIEFSAALWPGRKLARQLEALRRCQDTLGQWNDLKTAQARFEQAAAEDGRAWFGVGWAQARCAALRAQAAAQLRAWAEAPTPWRGE